MANVSIYEGKGRVIRQIIVDSLNLEKAILATASASTEDSVGMQSLQSARNYFNAAGFRTEDFSFNPYVFLLGHRDIHIYPPEKRGAKSPSSQAVYLARSEDKMGGLLLQLILPHSHTSKHYHTGKTETFHGMEGEGMIDVDGNVMHVYEGSAFTVYPNYVHQLYTDNYPALVLLFIEGDPKGLSMDDHNYVE